jgi:hypothetical protein
LDHIPYLKRYDLHGKVAEYNKFVDDLIEGRKKQILDGSAHKDNLLTQFVQASMPTSEKDPVMTDRELRVYIIYSINSLILILNRIT